MLFYKDVNTIFFQEKSYLVKTKVNLSNTVDLSFLSLNDIYGINRIYHPCSAISRKAGESIEYGHFVMYIFDGEECRVYDDNRINYVPTKSVLVDEEFQRSIDAVSYIHKIDNIKTQSLPNSQWSLTHEKEEEVKGIFISQTDEDFRIVRSPNIRSLDGKRWSSSEVINGAFEFMSSKLKCIERLSYITMEPYATESFNFNSLKEKMSEYTKTLIIPILEKHNWFSIACYLNEKVIIFLDSISLEIKLKYFQKMLQIISLLFPVVNMEEWALMHPDNLSPQIDGFNCGIHEFSTLIIYFFQTLIKLMLLQTTVMKILQLLAIGLLTD